MSIFKQFSQLFSEKLRSYVLATKKILKMNIEYQLNGFSILLPAEHMLPVFQKCYPLYDRFLPHICKYLGDTGTVIDVGANCGDTFVAMFANNSELSYICIEPDDRFYKLLCNNIARIHSHCPSAHVSTCKTLIGKDITSASLEGVNGTKHAIVNDTSCIGKSTLKSQTLDSIATSLSAQNIKLLKSDVDGFDYDVIDSAEETIKKCNPILFFECQIDHNYQRTGFENTIIHLSKAGYTNWTIFDNFGELVFQTNNAEEVNQLFGYVWRMSSGHSQITFPYFDLLAATIKDEETVSRAVTEYIGRR
jgi:FkbM family methyltransferase